MKYHLAALFTVTIWSITYISSKVVLGVLTPMQLTLYRFIIGYICLLIIKRPATIRLNLKDDLNIILSGFFGIFLYYLVENSATRLTHASYVSIIVSIIPLITSILAHFFHRDEKFSFIQIVTFILSFSGIVIIMLEGATLEAGVATGNLFALLGAVIFSFYNIFLKRIPESFDPIDKARRINFYGLIFLLIVFLFYPEKAIPSGVYEPVFILNILFLGIVASSMCILSWSYAVSGIGSTTTSRYIYLAPMITTIVSNFILHEAFTIYKILGICLILSGMFFPILLKKIKKQPNSQMAESRHA